MSEAYGDYAKKEKELYWPVFSRFDVSFKKGRGVYLYDESGKEYLDFITGVGVVPLGHSHPRVNERLFEQADEMFTCSNLFYSRPQLRLAEKLNKFIGEGRWFFSNSGAEAVEAALKVARRYAHLSGKKKILALKNSFHGRTFGAMSATGQEKIRKGYGELLSGFYHLTPGDFEELEEVFDEAVAAVIVEVIQGESGVRILNEDYLKRIYELSKKMGALFIVDEVQTGLGRTGQEFLASQKRGIEPDVVAIAKGLANGLPIGGTWIRKGLDELLKPGDHGSTYGGNALCCSVAESVIDVLNKEDMIKKNNYKGALFMQELFKFLHKNDKVIDIRGEGLMVAVEIIKPEAGSVISKMIKKGVLAGKGGETVIRFLPPFIAEEEHFKFAAEVLKDSLEV